MMKIIFPDNGIKPVYFWFLLVAALKLAQDFFRWRPRAHEVINCEIADVLSLEIFLIWLVLMIILRIEKKMGWLFAFSE